jgi:GAF domain-containing protein
MEFEGLEASQAPVNDQKEIDLFWHISQSLVSKKYLEEILHLIVTMTAEVMGSKICSLMLLDEDKGELGIAATQTLSEAYTLKPNVKVGESVSGRAIQERKPMMVLDVTKDKTYGYPEIARQEGIVSMLSVPMAINDRMIGVINSYTTQKHRFTDREIKVLQAVANQAAVAIENTKLRQENTAVKQAMEERKFIDQAKGLLMDKDGLKEAEAYQLIQKASRDRRLPMVEVAQAIILAYTLKKQ